MVRVSKRKQKFDPVSHTSRGREMNLVVRGGWILHKVSWDEIIVCWVGTWARMLHWG